jgi:hypothetical protein
LSNAAWLGAAAIHAGKYDYPDIAIGSDDCTELGGLNNTRQ